MPAAGLFSDIKSDLFGSDKKYTAVSLPRGPKAGMTAASLPTAPTYQERFGAARLDRIGPMTVHIVT